MVEGSQYCIGVNRPAIVREIPHFGLFPAFLRECPAFLALFRNNKKSLKIAIMFAGMIHFVRKSTAKTAMIASPR